MFILFLLLLNVLMLFFTFSSFSDKKRIFVPLAEAISVFLCLYSVFSAVMWIFEVFTVEFCVVAVTIPITAVFAFAYFKSKRKGLAFFSFGEMKADHGTVINRCVIVLATLVSLGAYSTIGIGYNDGNAQIQALSILNGQKSLHFEIDEYETITPGSRYELYFFDSVNNLDKENFTANYRLSSVNTEDGKVERMTGEYGSNPVYPSILALSATLFGTQRMAFIQAVFAFCLLIFVDEILRVLKCDWKLRTVLVLLLGLSPIIVYCNHTTLVEPLIGFCMVMFLYFLMCRKDKLQMLSVLGAVTFAFLQSSFYIMLPLFLVLCWMYYIHTGKIRHIISSGLLIAGYALSFVFLCITAYENTAIIYRLGIPFLKNRFYIFVIAAAAASLIAGIVFTIVVKKANPEKMTEFKRNKGAKIFKVLMAVAAAATIPATVVIIILKCYTFQDFLSITIIAFTVCSGVIIIPYVLVRLISMKYYVGIKEASVVISFVYAVILYSVVMNYILDGYYYESRYISSFMPFVIIIAGMMLKLLKKEEKYFIPIIAIIVMAVPYSFSLMDIKAETRFDKDIFEDVLETVNAQADEETIVLVEKDLLKYFYFPLALTTDYKVYPIDRDNYETFCKDLNDYTTKAIYITNDDENEYLSRGEVCFANSNIQNTPSVNFKSPVLGLPNRFEKSESDLVQVVKFDGLHCLLNYNLYDEMDVSDIDLKVEDVVIEDNDLVRFTISVTDESEILYNEKYFLSYHLEYENEEDIFDLPRTAIGPLTVDNYTLCIHLADQPEDVTVVFDIVEEGVAWYSWENKVPVVVFSRKDGVWDYKLYNLFAKVK